MRNDRSPDWRYGFIEVEAKGFGENQWVRTGQTITIQPNNSITALEKTLSTYKAKVRLYVPDL